MQHIKAISLGKSKLQKGDVFKIKTFKGFGFLQYVKTDTMGLACVRVLSPLLPNGEISQAAVDLVERWNIGFPLKAAQKRKIVELVGSFALPKHYVYPIYSRSEHWIRGEFMGWHIVHNESLQRTLKINLDDHDLKLSPHGIMNYTLLIEWLEQNWRLADWK